MRLLFVTTLILACSAVAAGAAGQAAKIRLTGTAPIRVSGLGFAPADRVTVRFSQPGHGSTAKAVVATRSGTFTVRFPARTLDECSGWEITATASSGRRAARRDLIPPPCGIEISP